MIQGILSKLFGGVSSIPTVDHYEIKQYAGTLLQNTWTASVVHETTNGFAFVDIATGSPITVSGTVKVTGVLVPATPETTVTPVTPAV
jgi:hypothetical protein